MELKCPGCSARFRLTLTGEIDPNESVSCPKCGTSIPVRPAPTEQGWARRDHSRIFGRTPEAKPASRAPTRTPRGGRGGTPGRVFKDITTVDASSAPPARPRDDGGGDDEESRPASSVERAKSEPSKPAHVDRDPTLERPLPNAGILRREGIGAGAGESAADDGDDSQGEVTGAKPAPERPFEVATKKPKGALLGRLRPPPSFADDSDDEPWLGVSEAGDGEPHGEANATRATGVSESHGEGKATREASGGDRKTTGQASASPLQDGEPKTGERSEANVPSSDEPTTSKLSTSELLAIVRDRRNARTEVDLRVGERIFDNVTVDQLVEVLARGVVAETLSCRGDEGGWEPLVEQPIYQLAARRLAARSEAVVEEVVTGEVARRERDPESSSTEDSETAPAKSESRTLPKPPPRKPAPPPHSGSSDPEQPADAVAPHEPVDSKSSASSDSSKVSAIEATIPSPTQKQASSDAPEESTYTPAEPRTEPPGPDGPEETEETEETETAVAETPDSSISLEFSARNHRKPRWPFVLVITAVVASAASAYLLSPYFRPPPPEPPPPVQPPPPEALRAGFQVADSARAIAIDKAKLRKRDTAAIIAEARTLLDRSNFGDALNLGWELRRRAPNNAEAIEILARAHAGTGDYHAARRAIAELAAREELPRNLVLLFRESLQVDPSIPPPVRTLPKDEQIDLIKALGGGKSLSFKLYRDDEKVYAFKPAQAEWDDGWRSEIAAYTLCEILPCEFEVPRSFTARITRSTWEELYPMSTLKQADYATEFERLQWRVEPTRDGDEEEVLYGVAKHWVPTFVDWPIEYTDVWEPWLDPTEDDALLDQPLAEAISGLDGRGEHYDKVLSELGDATTTEVARQLSNVMVFDFLINNWDRFSTLEDYYGVNNQFVDGHFVSIDNGAGFHTQESDRVTERFRDVQRFSRSMIAAVRLLDRELVDPLLFPNATDDEKRRLDVFWERRRQLLERVDALVAEHGEDAVLYFE